MMLAGLPQQDLRYRLKRQGICLHIGPFIVRIHSHVRSVIEGLQMMYADYAYEEDADFADFHVCLAAPRNIRRLLRPQVDFIFDGHRPFKPLPLAQAFPFFEWGVNWCIAGHSHQYVIFHAATIEKGGRALIMPGDPGAGKSTLCAALVSRGWRLLSDELTLLPVETTEIVPVPRPVSLKNESIDIIREFEPSAVIGHATRDTTKGTVAHMKAPRESIERSGEPAKPAWIIFPAYTAGAQGQLVPEAKGQAFMRLIKNAFNYSTLGEVGFNAVADLVETCDCYDYRYSNLDDAVADIDRLAFAATAR